MKPVPKEIRHNTLLFVLSVLAIVPLAALLKKLPPGCREVPMTLLADFACGKP